MEALATLTEHKKAKIKALSKQLGEPEHIQVTSANRHLVRGWLNGLGIPSHLYESATLEELQEAYYSITMNYGGLRAIISKAFPDNGINGAYGRETLDQIQILTHAAAKRVYLYTSYKGGAHDPDVIMQLPVNQAQAASHPSMTTQTRHMLRDMIQLRMPAHLNIVREEATEAFYKGEISERQLLFVMQELMTEYQELTSNNKTTNPTTQEDNAMTNSAQPLWLKAEPQSSEPTPELTAQEPKPVKKQLPVSEDEATKHLLAALNHLSAISGGKKSDLDEGRVIELIKQHSSAVSTKLEIKVNNTNRILDEVHHFQLPVILKAVASKVNIMLVGPAGSGKTTIAHQCAKSLLLPFYFNGALSSEYKLTGFMDANGKLVRTPFREAYEHGGVYLFDEIDASMPDALLAFNAALSNDHADFPDGTIKKHENFYCIAAANTYGKGADRIYVGRSQLDGASLDRFAMIDLDYDEKLEKALASNDDWVDYVQSVRKAVDKTKIRHIVSPRASIEGAKLLAAGIAKKQVEDSIIWKGLDNDSKAKVKAAI